MRLIAVVPLIALFTSGCAMAVHRAIAGSARPDIGQMLQNADENGDGRIARAEYVDSRRKLFERLDRNGDGYLSADDAPRRLAARRGDSGRLGQAVAILDKNGDGRISRDEFVNGPSLIFERADANHDGVIDAQELARFRAAAAARAGATAP